MKWRQAGVPQPAECFARGCRRPLSGVLYFACDVSIPRAGCSNSTCGRLQRTYGHTVGASALAHSGCGSLAKQNGDRDRDVDVNGDCYCDCRTVPNPRSADGHRYHDANGDCYSDPDPST